MRTPDEEQQGIDALVRTDLLVVDDLGIGGETSYARQILQEILDARDCSDRHGLVLTSPYSPVRLARRLDDRTIPSRLSGMCEVVEMRGFDHRAVNRSQHLQASRPPMSSVDLEPGPR
jgi:DNA replication protein DnaC